MTMTKQEKTTLINKLTTEVCEDMDIQSQVELIWGMIENTSLDIVSLYKVEGGYEIFIEDDLAV